jgi:hypothetical protein
MKSEQAVLPNPYLEEEEEVKWSYMFLTSSAECHIPDGDSSESSPKPF